MIVITDLSSLALTKIKEGMTVSLGGGHNVLNLAKAISQHKELDVKLCSPSELTRSAGQALGLKIQPLSNFKQIDLAFDGCDSVDYNLSALKSGGGGIHLFEKIAAQMSKEYILLLPKERIEKRLSVKVPLCIEVAEPATRQLIQFCEKLGLKVVLRQADKVASFARSPQGNLLIDAFTNTNWQEITMIDEEIRKQNGVVATSYFANLVTSLITTNQNDELIEIKKGQLK